MTAKAMRRKRVTAEPEKEMPMGNVTVGEAS